MTDPAFGLATIGQILVPVRDAEVATAFYRDVLGMRFLFAFPHMAFFDADGVRLYLAEPEEPDFRGRSTLYFRVPDIAGSRMARRIRIRSPASWETSDATALPAAMRPPILRSSAAISAAPWNRSAGSNASARIAMSESRANGELG